jgi:hypothetical protein
MRTREEAVRIDVRFTLLLLACMAVAFAGFFAVGHVTRSGASVPRAYGPQKLPAVSVRAGIPYGLAPAAAIAVPVAAARSEPRAARSQPPAASSPRTYTPSVRASSPARVVEAAPAPQSPVPPVRSVAPAPVQSAPPPVSKPRGGGSAVEGGSFDSSG